MAKAKAKPKTVEVLKVRPVVEQVEEILDDTDLDISKWDKEHNGAAAARIRKQLQEVIKICKELRRGIQDSKNEMKAAKKGKK